MRRIFAFHLGLYSREMAQGSVGRFLNSHASKARKCTRGQDLARRGLWQGIVERRATASLGQTISM